jgi:hypothetical protein
VTKPGIEQRNPKLRAAGLPTTSLIDTAVLRKIRGVFYRDFYGLKDRVCAHQFKIRSNSFC